MGHYHWLGQYQYHTITSINQWSIILNYWSIIIKVGVVGRLSFGGSSVPVCLSGSVIGVQCPLSVVVWGLGIIIRKGNNVRHCPSRERERGE